MQADKDCVGVIEDDAAVRGAICRMLGSLAIDVHSYPSAHDYLEDPVGTKCCCCLVLDVRLPGISGIELQKQLQNLKRTPAIVFITGHADVPMVVEAMRNGAVDFLQKPFREQQLLDSVQSALALHRRNRATHQQSDLVAARLACLTAREHEVLERLLRGLRTKEVAAELGISARTAEEHRANLMHKMHASTIVELVSICSPLFS
jgi:FixJ family two-component response regulator